VPYVEVCAVTGQGAEEVLILVADGIERRFGDV
jgi:hypothetical protein